MRRPSDNRGGIVQIYAPENAKDPARAPAEGKAALGGGKKRIFKNAPHGGVVLLDFDWIAADPCIHQQELAALATSS
jgi:hypothetical protein